MPISQSSSSRSFQPAARPRGMCRSASRPPPSYAQVLAEKYGMLPSASSTHSTGGFSDYQDSTDAEEENNNQEYVRRSNQEEFRRSNQEEFRRSNQEGEEEVVPIYQISMDTNEAIFMQRCIKWVGFFFALTVFFCFTYILLFCWLFERFCKA